MSTIGVLARPTAARGPGVARLADVADRADLADRTDLADLADRALPAWPVTGLFALYPLWWLLGLTPFVLALAGGVCTGLLLLRRRVELPPMWLWWAAFLAWSLLSVVMVDTGGRLAGFAQRWLELLGAAAVLLYAYNAPELLTRRRLLRGLASMLAWLVIGGGLGMLLPYARVTTPLLRLLPTGLANNSYVIELLSPRFAEVQDPWGATSAFIRPAAPFPYTNAWGNTFVMLVLIVAALAVTARRRARLVLAAGVALAVPPALATLNRGIFVGLAAGGGYALLRGLRWLRRRDLLRLAAALAVLAAVIVGSGAIARIAERTSASSTTQDRATLYAETFQRTLASPLIGWGAPRPSRSLPVPAGTQGELWYLMFSHGFVGLALFLGGLWGLVFASWRVRDAESLLLHAVPVSLGVMMLFYGLDGLQLTMAASCALVLIRPQRLAAVAVAP